MKKLFITIVSTIVLGYVFLLGLYYLNSSGYYRLSFRPPIIPLYPKKIVVKNLQSDTHPNFIWVENFFDSHLNPNFKKIAFFSSPFIFSLLISSILVVSFSTILSPSDDADSEDTVSLPEENLDSPQ